MIADKCFPSHDLTAKQKATAGYDSMNKNHKTFVSKENKKGSLSEKQLKVIAKGAGYANSNFKKFLKVS